MSTRLLFARAALSAVALAFTAPDARADSWPMRNRDMHNTGRADFSIPASRLNATLFEVPRWQKPAPCCPGDFTATSLSFYDGAGPAGRDLVVGGYHWPKGVQGMDRHTGQLFWRGNPAGGETIGRASPAFSPDGDTIYVINDATESALMAFPAATGPATWRGFADPGDPDTYYFGIGSPLVAPDGRIFSWGWANRAGGAIDTGTALTVDWVADADVGTCYGGNALYEYAPGNLRVISNGRYATVRSHDGFTGATVWSRSIQFTDCPPTVDPASGQIYIPAGSGDIWVIGLSRDGANLWGSTAWKLVYDFDGENAPHTARSAGCLSHDGSTFYFQTTTSTVPGEGRLWAINTGNGTLKWSCLTQAAASGESWDSCPIVTPNGVILVGNNAGDTYLAIQDEGDAGTIRATFAVDPSGTAAATPTLSADGLLYLPVRTDWIVSNGNTETPTLAPTNVFTAFDLNEGAELYYPIPEGPLPPPTGLVVAPYYSTAHVYWNAVSEPQVAGYVVYRRTADGAFTVPYKRVLRSSFTDYGLTPGDVYYYAVLAIDGSGVPLSQLSAEAGATLGTDPAPYAVHKNLELLVVLYKGGFTPTQVTQLTNGIQLGIDFYWRTSGANLNLDATWLFIDGYPPGDSWYHGALQADLYARGVQDHQFDLGYLVGNNTAGCLGGYVVFGSMCASLGHVCGVPYPGRDPYTDYTVAWTFTHELHHALEVMENITPDTPEVLFCHFPWCYPDPLGPSGWHMDWGSHYDGIALTNREYADQWLLLPEPYDGYLECLDSDGDRLPDADARVPQDEARFGTSPLLTDADDDGLDDLAEYSAYNFRGTDPADPDSDNDGLQDSLDPRPLYAAKAYVPRLAAPPVIDGTLEAGWPLLQTGYYFTKNPGVFTLETYVGWDADALYLAVRSSRKLRFMLSLDGSGQDGRFESPVRHVAGATDTLNPDNKGNHYGDSWGDGNHIYFAHGLTTCEVWCRGAVSGAQVASTLASGVYTTELRLPRVLPKGAAYTWYPPGETTPVVDGLTLWPGHLLGLNLTVSNYTGSDGSEFSGTWTSLFETHAYADFALQAAGDLNCDGALDFRDINPFVLALSNPAAYETAYPACTRWNADINGDGAVGFADINRFVALLSGQ